MLAILIALVLIVLVPAYAAGDEDDYKQAKKLHESGAIVSLETIVEKALAAHPGKVIEVELEDKHEQIVYELEVLDLQGMVWEMKFDARSGELLTAEKEN